MANGSGAPPLFREVQHFRQLWLWLIVLAVSGFATYAMVQQLILGAPFGSNLAPDCGVIGIMVVFGFGLPIFMYATHLTTEVRSDGLYYRFFPFHCSFQRIAAGDVKRYEVLTYSPIKDYGGWGIRYGVGGKAYNVSGNRGVLLHLSNGRGLLIGSQRPEEFANALALACGKRR